MEDTNTKNMIWDWQEDDSVIVETIKTRVDSLMHDKFAKGYSALTELFMKARIPLEDEFGNPQMVNGEVQWKRNADGTIIENWANIEPKYLDNFVLKAGMFIVFAGQEALNAKMESTFARYANEDAYAEVYRNIDKGTIKDKESLASLQTLESRYFALYKKHFEEKSKDFIDRVDSYIRRIEKIRDMQMRDTEREIKLQLRG